MTLAARRREMDIGSPRGAWVYVITISESLEI